MPRTGEQTSLGEQTTRRISVRRARKGLRDRHPWRQDKPGMACNTLQRLVMTTVERTGLHHKLFYDRITSQIGIWQDYITSWDMTGLHCKFGYDRITLQVGIWQDYITRFVWYPGNRKACNGFVRNSVAPRYSWRRAHKNKHKHKTLSVRAGGYGLNTANTEFCYSFLVSIATAIIEILWAVLNNLMWVGWGGVGGPIMPNVRYSMCVCVCVCVA